MPKGGKRQGAGRPKQPQVKKRVTISLRPSLIEQLKGENKNRLIEELLVVHFKRKLIEKLLIEQLIERNKE